MVSKAVKTSCTQRQKIKKIEYRYASKNSYCLIILTSFIYWVQVILTKILWNTVNLQLALLNPFKIGKLWHILTVKLQECVQPLTVLQTFQWKTTYNHFLNTSEIFFINEKNIPKRFYAMMLFWSPIKKWNKGRDFKTLQPKYAFLQLHYQFVANIFSVFSEENTLLPFFKLFFL